MNNFYIIEYLDLNSNTVSVLFSYQGRELRSVIVVKDLTDKAGILKTIDQRYDNFVSTIKENQDTIPDIPQEVIDLIGVTVDKT